MSNTANTVLPSSDDIRLQASSFGREAVEWVQGHWTNILIAAALAVGIAVALHLVRAWGLRLCRRGEGIANWYAIIGRAIGKTGNFFIVMAAIRLVVGYSRAPGPLSATVLFLFTIAAVFQAAIWVREIVFGVVEHRTQAEGEAGVAYSSALGIIRLLVTIVLFAVALVVVLSNVGVNVTGLVAGLGVGGIAIGLAAQGIFADLFAALAILFDKPFRIGDSISYDKGAGSGTVEAIGLKSTRVRGGNGEMRIVANKKLLDFEILNTTERTRNRFKFDFTLGYATPPDLIEQIPAMLREAVESQGYKLVHGGLNGFGAHGLSYDVEFESNGPDFPEGARDKVAAALLARFRDRQISFAYPTHVNLVAEKTKPTPPANAEPA
jgi:small-conductance mechanosensitive channel